jgi:glycerophosphoryl diester phosphodiesterase
LYALLLLAVLTGLFILLYWLSFRLQNIKKLTPLVTIAIGLVFLSLDGNVISNFYRTLSLNNANNYSLRTAINELPIKDLSFIKKQDVVAQPGKNIIFISLESLESFELGFIKERKDLTPNLNKLVDTGSLYEMEPTTGGDWISASVYMAITGLPASFGSEGNDVFQGAKDFYLSTLGDVLKTAGYQMTYLIANKHFSGINDMLETFVFEVKSEIDFETSYERIPWGLHDKDLFEEIKKGIVLKDKQDKPFALFASTVSTHFPNGLYDKRMEGIIEKKNSDLEFMIASVDQYVGDLMAFLKKEKLLEDTAVIIVPDHLFMAKHEVVSQLDQRSLLVLTSEKNKQWNQEALQQISMPRTILNLASINTNATFLCDFIEGNKNQFIDSNEEKRRDLNLAALKTFDLKQVFEIVIIDDSILIIDLEEQTTIEIFEISKDSTHVFKIILDDKYRVRSSEDVFPLDLKNSVSSPSTLHIIYEDGKLSSFLSDPDGIVSYKKGSKITYDSIDVQSKFSKYEVGKEIDDKLLQKEEAMLVIKSASFNSKKRSWIKCNEDQIWLDRGINLVKLDITGTMVNLNYDTYLHPEVIDDLIKQIELSRQSKSTFFLIVHYTAGENFKDYKDQLAQLNLEKLIDLKIRQAYLAKLDKEKTEEFISDFIVEKQFTVPYKKPVAQKNKEEAIALFSKDVDRFIAHAGGAVQGNSYTNSLEALNASYKKGFRLFELDIIKTSDGEFVAAHDWNIWQEQTGYQGITPVSLEVFNSYKILKDYNSLDMQAINTWFSSHKDALLITDKTRDIEQFANSFIDYKRLRMEIFTFPDVLIANALGVEPMLSENRLNNLKDKTLEYIKEHHIKYIVFSRASISKNRKLEPLN